MFSSVSERWDFRQKKERKREWPQSLGGWDRKMAPSSNQPGLHGTLEASLSRWCKTLSQCLRGAEERNGEEGGGG